MISLDIILAEVISARTQAEAAERAARSARKGLELLQAQIEASILRKLADA